MAAAANKLKVGLVLDTSLDPDDGVQQYVVGLGEWLRGQGHDVHYLVGQTNRRQLPNVHSLARNVSVRFNGNRTTVPIPTSRQKLRAFLAAHHFDVLHVQVPHSPFMAQRLIMEAGKDTAVIGTFHIAPYNRLVTAANRALGIWLKPSLKRFDKMLSVSPAAASFAKTTFGIDSEVLPNVIDYDLYHGSRPLSEYDDDVLTILFLGRLVPRKGALRLVKAAALLKQQAGLPPFRVLVCGKGPQEAKIKRFIADNGLKDTVSLLGFIPEADKPRYYASADLAVFPSSGGESFGIVLLEAMASGQAAVLAGDNPGYRSVMSPQPSLLFNPGNTQVLAAKLAHYLQDQTDRGKMAAWGAAYAKGFDVNTVGRQLEAIYRQTLRKRLQA